ncbi:MAG: hypothetical protein ACK5Q5_06640 [Planctomycetaceae bacterium]
MDGDRHRDERREWAVFGLAGLSTAVTVASVGVRLTGALGAAPIGFAVLLSALVTGLNVAALALLRQQPLVDVRRWLAYCGLGLIGPVWTVCAWGSGWGVAAWILSLAATGFAACLWQLPMSKNAAAERPAQPNRSLDPPRQTTPVATSAAEEATNSAALADEVSCDALLMRLERRVAEDEERIELEYHLELNAAETHRTLHIPISPPLTTIPEVECEPLDDAAIEIQVAAAFTYGIRLELRRSTAAVAPLHTTIGVVISAPVHTSSAA